MCSTFKQRPIRPPLAGIVVVALLLLAAPLAAQDSSDATLSNLTLSLADETLDPAFDSATTSYTAKVGHEVETVTVTATRNDPVGGRLIHLAGR